MNLAHAAQLRRQQIGASLIEILVSVVIASIGLLALAGINAASLRYSKLSQYRATATLMANDITERARANNAGGTALQNYSYTATYAVQIASAPAAPGTLCNTTAATCTSVTMAAFDLYEWRRTVADNLPRGAAFLLPDATVSTAADLWIIWQDVAVANTDEQVRAGGARECPFGLGLTEDQTSVRCLYFRVKI